MSSWTSWPSDSKDDFPPPVIIRGVIDKRWLVGLLLVAGACGQPGANQAEVQRQASVETCGEVQRFTEDSDDLKGEERLARIKELFEVALSARLDLAEAAEAYYVAQTNGDPQKGAVFLEQLQKDCGLAEAVPSSG